jgi:CubicO group peptidase (beta-lactamase class C family)
MMAVQHGKVRALEAAGFADAATKTPMRTDAIFDIRSISKPFTVFAAFLLIDERKFALDDPLSKLLPEFANVKVKGQTQPTNVPITIRQMMMHSSGIAEDRPPELENITRTFDHTLAEDVALVAQQPLDFTPGTKWAYSSSGIAVLGRVIEVVSGQPYETFMQQRVFQPLEMHDSSFFTDKAKAARIPTMYNLEKGLLANDVMDVTRPNQKYSAPEFGMFSTAEDLRHYCQMMLDRGFWKGRRILSAGLVDEMSKPQMHTPILKYEAGLGYAGRVQR